MADDGFMRSGRGAETADRMDREAWGRTYKSAYAHHLQMPERVEAGDYEMARTILYRIQAQVEKGGWTTNEWLRLHALEKAWGNRGAGRDLQFNMRGWQRKGTGHNLPQVEKTMRAIQKAIEESEQ